MRGTTRRRAAGAEAGTTSGGGPTGPRYVGPVRTGVDDVVGLVVRLADPGHGHDRVRLWCDVVLGGTRELCRVDGGWELTVGLPDLDCLEYLLDVDGVLVTDPGNPDTVDGAFGPHSWVALPGYRPPAWLDAADAAAVAGGRHRTTAAGVDVEVWQPHDGPLPLLLVHDGPQMDRFGAVVGYAASLPPVRVALLAPGARDDVYSANPDYTGTLVGDVLPRLLDEHPTTHRPVLLGQSLGALAALHAVWTAPGAFAGVALQSGSFFTPELDPQESGFAFFERVTGFVAAVTGAGAPPAGMPPVVMTCGTAEENLANNRALRDHLLSIGVQVTWGEARQGHTWTCWRDTLDPHLTGLLARVWR